MTGTHSSVSGPLTSNELARTDKQGHLILLVILDFINECNHPCHKY